MFKSQNITPQRFALIITCIMTAVILIICLILRADWFKVLILTSSFFIINFLLVRELFRSYIYKNVRLIYKLITRTRASKKDEFLLKKITPKKSLDEVTEEVIAWAEEKNQEIQNLHNNEAFRKEFLQNLAHEIKTPLFTAQGYLDTLKDGAIHDKEIAMEFITKASNSVERLTELTKDIVNISKLESGQIELEKEFFNVKELITEVFEEFEIFRKNKNAHFTFKSGFNPDVKVYADRSRIRQVLVNLVQNALKYGQNDMEVSIGCYILDPETAYIEVSDNGPGIEESHLPRLFERFYRLDKSRDRKIGGTGLGLAIVKHIIEAHEQTVNVRSTIQIGTTFGFTLSKKKK